MKTQAEIVIKAKAYAESIGNEDGTSAYDYVMGYNQCQKDIADKKYTLRDIEKAFLEGCASERKFSRRIDDLDKYIISLNKQD